jgi:hypothetical protein
MRLYMLERACELELMARQMDEPPIQIDHDVIEKAAIRMRKMRQTEGYGLAEWRGLVRQVDRKGFDYRV